MFRLCEFIRHIHASVIQITYIYILLCVLQCVEHGKTPEKNIGFRPGRARERVPVFESAEMKTYNGRNKNMREKILSVDTDDL